MVLQHDSKYTDYYTPRFFVGMTEDLGIYCCYEARIFNLSLAITYGNRTRSFGHHGLLVCLACSHKTKTRQQDIGQRQPARHALHAQQHHKHLTGLRNKQRSKAWLHVLLKSFQNQVCFVEIVEISENRSRYRLHLTYIWLWASSFDIDIDAAIHCLRYRSIFFDSMHMQNGLAGLE